MKAIVPEVLRRVYLEIGENEQEYFLKSQLRYTYVLMQLVNSGVPDQSQILLDIGSHWMHMTMAASLLGFNCYGLDLSYFARDDMLVKRAMEYGIKLGCFDLSDHRIPFENHSFATILFSEVLEHLAFSPMPALAEIRRVLKPGGILLLTTPNVFSSGNRLRMLLGHKNIYTNLEHFLEGPCFSIHWREYTMSEVQRLLRLSGFKVMASRYFDANLNTKGLVRAFVKRRIYTIITLLFPRLRNCMFFLARKPETEKMNTTDHAETMPLGAKSGA
jgi:SAM-dependent methyltransferase